MNAFNPNMTEIIEHRRHNRGDRSMSTDEKRKRDHVRARNLQYKMEDERIENDPFFYIDY